MKLLEFKKQFQLFLKDEFPDTEINSFFNILIENYLGLSRLEFALNPEKEVTSDEFQNLNTAMLKLKEHEPLQYILGETEFFGLKFKVDPNTLIPRPETEELVSWILSDIEQDKTNSQLNILDIGTGSGCIAISLAKNLPKSSVFAIDVSSEALKIASENAQLNEVFVDFSKTDILNTESLLETFHIIVSNPPYVRELEKVEMHRNVLENEPDLALYVSNEDPLIFYRKITSLAKNNLPVGGCLYFEINQYLSKETEDLMKKEGFKTTLKKDIFGNFRMIKGVKK